MLSMSEIQSDYDFKKMDENVFFAISASKTVKFIGNGWNFFQVFFKIHVNSLYKMVFVYAFEWSEIFVWISSKNNEHHRNRKKLQMYNWKGYYNPIQ